MPAVLYYISGHGFGHARRCAETIRELQRCRPDIRVHVRTMANRAIFADLPVAFAQVPIDRGAVEIDALTLNWPATLAAVRELIDCRETVIRDEGAYIREHDIGLLIADVPFMAGYIASAAGVPCYAHCNFMWDWIYEPHTDDRQLLEFIAEGYRRMTGWLRLPLPHACDHFQEIQEVPFICSRPNLSAKQARERIGLRSEDRRPVVLVAMRGGTDPAILRSLDALSERYALITAGAEHSAKLFAWPRGLSFWDVMQVADVVLSKPGHGIVSDCATMGVSLLYPPRNGFREDPMILGEAARYFRQRQLPLADYASGSWEAHLDALLAEARPKPAPNCDGASWVAQWIARRF